MTQNEQKNGNDAMSLIKRTKIIRNEHNISALYKSDNSDKATRQKLD